MPAASRMASKTPPFLLMSLETGLSEAPSQSWPESKHPWGSRLGGKRVCRGSGVRVSPLAQDQGVKLLGQREKL